MAADHADSAAASTPVTVSNACRIRASSSARVIRSITCDGPVSPRRSIGIASESSSTIGP